MSLGLDATPAVSCYEIILNCHLASILHNNNSLWDRNAYNHQGCRIPRSTILDTSLCMSFVEAPAAPVCCVPFISHPFNMIKKILRP
jgi:hypothetical protein